MSKNWNMRKYLTRLDLITAAIGAFVLAALIPWLVLKEFHTVYLITVGVGLGCIGLYLALRQRMTEAGNTACNTEGNSVVSWGLVAGAFLLCLLAWLSFVFRSEQYVKQLAYYVLMAGATGLAFYGILRSKGGLQTYAVVGLACIVGLSHIWTEHLLFPGSLIGLDPWTHQTRTAGQPDFSTLGGSYSLMHLYLKSAIDLFGISYKWAALIFVGSLQTVGIILFTFLLGRMLWSVKVGCVAGLMVASANWVIFFGEWVIPNALGATYSLAVAYLVLKMSKGNTKWLFALVALLVLAACATHLMAIMWVLGTLACLWIMPVLFEESLSAKAKLAKLWRRSVIPLLVVLSVTLLLQVTALGDTAKLAIGTDIFAPSYGVTYAIGKAPLDEQISESVVELVFKQGGSVLGEMALDSLGMILYIGLAIPGCLMMLRRTTVPAQRAFVALSLAVLSIGFFPPLFGLSVIEHRWWYFAEVLLAVPLGVALVSLSATGRWRAIPVVVLATIIVFLSTIGLMSNMTNRTLSPNLIVRYAFTEGEMLSLVVAKDYNPQSIGTDPVFLAFVRANTDESVEVISLADEILSRNFSRQPADVLLLRDALSSEPFGYGTGAIYKLSYDFVEAAVQQGYAEVWRNEEVVCLIIERTR